MSHRPLFRAAALAMSALLLTAGIAHADSVAADGDVLSSTVDGTVNLGSVDPGAEVIVDVRFVLACAGLSHVDPGQSIRLAFAGGSQPGDGAIVSVSSATLDPVEGTWAADDEGCPTPAPTTDNGSWSRVTLRAPTVPGHGYTYSVMWDRALSPEGADDAGALSRTPTAVDFTLDVLGDAAPSLDLPLPFTVEGDTTGGWTADWAAVSATDAEDDPDPTPTCTPAGGATVPLGTTSVVCSVTDTAGQSDSGTFDVTVVDTRAPALVGMPIDQAVTTSDPTGTNLAYTPPTATDVVDPAPAVICLPAVGDHVGLGTTTVTCTATDASGNAASDTFDVVISYQAPHSARATWLEPVGSAGSLEANRGRNVPIKVQLFVDGIERQAGVARLSLVPCGGGDASVIGLLYSGGRWNASLDTARLPAACYTISAVIDELTAGAFTLELRGTEAARTGAKTGTSRR